MGIEYISIKGAAQRLGMTEDEVLDLIRHKKVEYKIEYGIAKVTKDSVYAYSGISPTGHQTKKKSKGGRPPATVSYADAAKILEENISTLVACRLLETYDTGDELRVTERSIKAYQKKLADMEVQACEEDVTDTDVGEIEEFGPDIDVATITDESYEHNDNFDMSEERDLNDGNTPSEYKRHDYFKLQPEEPLVSSTDFTGMPDSVQEEQVKETTEDDNVIPLNEDDEYLKAKEKAKEAEERLKAMAEKPVNNPDMVTMKKDDFNAHMVITSMRAELGVYRSLKSFERR